MKTKNRQLIAVEIRPGDVVLGHLPRVRWISKRTNLFVINEVGNPKRWLSSEILSHIMQYFRQVVRANGMEALFMEGRVD